MIFNGSNHLLEYGSYSKRVVMLVHVAFVLDRHFFRSHLISGT